MGWESGCASGKPAKARVSPDPSIACTGPERKFPVEALCGGTTLQTAEAMGAPFKPKAWVGSFVESFVSGLCIRCQAKALEGELSTKQPRQDSWGTEK